MGKYNKNTKIKELFEDKRAVEIAKKYLNENILNSTFVTSAGAMSLVSALKYNTQIGLSPKDSNTLLEEIMNLE